MPFVGTVCGMREMNNGRVLDCKLDRRQRGHTLIEIAIVLVVLGLLASTALVARAMLHTTQVKALAADFTAIRTAMNQYQDRFRALPGDDAQAGVHLPGASPAAGPGAGNGMIDGRWDSGNPADESVLFWQHVRLAALLPGPVQVADAGYRPRNIANGFVGVSSASVAQLQIAGLRGLYQICSGNISGSFARLLDILLDDGDTASGSLRIAPNEAPLGAAAVPAGLMDDGASYVACQVF